MSELVKENNVVYEEIEEPKIELAEFNQYGRRENDLWHSRENRA